MISEMTDDIIIGKEHRNWGVKGKTVQFKLIFSDEEWKSLKKLVKDSNNYDDIVHYFRCELWLREPDPVVESTEK